MSSHAQNNGVLVRCKGADPKSEHREICEYFLNYAGSGELAATDSYPGFAFADASELIIDFKTREGTLVYCSPLCWYN